MAAIEDRFRAGDAVTDSDGNAGRVVSCRNTSTGEWFLSVRVTEGPKKGRWDQVYRYAPQLDHEGGTLRTTCLTCERAFLATVRKLSDLGGYVLPVQAYCRTCLPAGAREDQARAVSARSATDFPVNWKSESRGQGRGRR